MSRTGWKRVLCGGVLSLTLTVTAAFGQTKIGTLNAIGDFSSGLEATAVRVGPSVVEIFTTSYVPVSL